MRTSLAPEPPDIGDKGDLAQALPSTGVVAASEGAAAAEVEADGSGSDSGLAEVVWIGLATGVFEVLTGTGVTEKSIIEVGVCEKFMREESGRRPFACLLFTGTGLTARFSGTTTAAVVVVAGGVVCPPYGTVTVTSSWYST